MSNEIKVDEYYERSMEALKKYIFDNEKTITEIEWNRLAIKKKYLSSESIGYMSQIHFNKLCKNILKEFKKAKKNYNK